jgi:hypothetical protein
MLGATVSVWATGGAAVEVGGIAVGSAVGVGLGAGVEAAQLLNKRMDVTNKPIASAKRPTCWSVV